MESSVAAGTGRLDPETFAPVRMPRAFEEVARQIVDKLRAGEIREGDVLPGERTLAARLEVSRATVRLATSVLVHAGLLEVAPGRSGGARVVSMWVPESLIAQPPEQFDGDEVFRLLEARRAVEPRVARLAGLRASQTHYDRMRASIELQREHINEPLKAGQAESLWHRIMWQAAGNVTLEETMVMLFAKLEPAREALVGRSEHMEATVDVHERTLEALMRGGGEDIDSAMDEHLAYTERKIEESLGRRFARRLPEFLAPASPPVSAPERSE